MAAARSEMLRLQAARAAQFEGPLPVVGKDGLVAFADDGLQEHASGWPSHEAGLAALARDLLMDIGGGTGATVSSTGDTVLDQALLRRMRYQDKAVMLLLLLAYTGSLAFSASLAYRSAVNDSSVTYYADPRYHTIAVDGHDVEGFLDNFNQPPKDIQLQVSGLLPLPPLPEYVMDAAVEWFGARYRVAFAFALDLSPWLVRDAGPDQAGGGAAVGVDLQDLRLLRSFLASDTNDLAYVEMTKHVVWKDWEELATNIKSQIRQQGFTGVVSVRRNDEECVLVHKNRPWANFMHSRTTKVLCALSVFGWFIYQPYMWLRHRALTVRCGYRVDVSIDQYWPLIADKIGPDGFNSGPGAVQAPAGQPNPRTAARQ